MVKRPVREVDHSSPSSAEVENEWSYASTPSICLHNAKRENYLSHIDEEESIIQSLQTKLPALRSMHIAVLKGGPATRNTISHGSEMCHPRCVYK